jgi:hypothetical protein
MKRVDLQNATWLKSSYSNGNGNCVEVADLSDAVAIRDSKRPASPVLTSSVKGWRAFIGGVVNDELRGM